MDFGAFTQGRTRETAIRRDARGRWFDGADAITHPNLVRNFDSWIDRAPDGRFCLSNAINWAYVTIEGPAYWVRSLEILDAERLRVHLSGDVQEEISVGKIFVDGDHTLWCAVKEGRCPARFDNHAALQLGKFLVEGEAQALLRIDGHDHPLTPIHDPTTIGASTSGSL